MTDVSLNSPKLFEAVSTGSTLETSSAILLKSCRDSIVGIEDSGIQDSDKPQNSESLLGQVFSWLYNGDDISVRQRFLADET